MQNFLNILNEALKTGASELLLEEAKEVQLIKQNQIQSLSEHGILTHDPLHELAKQYLGENLASFESGNPQKVSFKVENYGDVQMIARHHNDATYLRFFLPPLGADLSQQYWETISAENMTPELSLNEDASQSVSLESETPAPELSLDSNTEQKAEGFSLEPTPNAPQDISIQATEAAPAPELTLETPAPAPELAIETPAPEPTPAPDLAIETPAPEPTPTPELAIESPIVEAIQAPISPEAALGLTPPPAVEVPKVSAPPPVRTTSDMPFDFESAVSLTSGPAPTYSTPSNSESAPASEPLPPLPPPPPPEAKPLKDQKKKPEVIVNIVGNISNLEALLKDMISHNASYLHLVPGQKAYLRIQDQLTAYGNDTLTEEMIESLVQAIVPEEHKNSWLKKEDVDFLFVHEERNYRVHVFKDLNGRSIVLRALSSVIPTMESLGLPQRVHQLCEFKHGLVLIAGPSETLTASILAGITQHMGSFLQGRIISLEKHLLFLQNPKVSLISQREVGLHTHSFAHGLRSAVQENPDLITLSHLADKSSAKLALKASAESLVFAGISAQSLAEARTILDGLLSESPKLLVDAVLREIVFAKMDANGKATYELLVSNSEVKAS